MTKILVVDDSLFDRELIRGIIKQGTSWEVDFAVDGKQALERLPEISPDAVVTDLQMPEMNGLELVARIREDYPALPIVLITSLGSEDLAFRALRAGANSYSPKRSLATDLLDTLQHVVAAARRLKNQKRLMAHVVNGSISWMLNNEVQLVVPFVEQVQAFVGTWGKFDQLRLGMAIDEALVNAMYHGNLEVDSKLREDDHSAFFELIRERSSRQPYADRRVYVQSSFTPEEFRIVIRDEGRGFDPASLPDPADPENLQRTHGRGLLLIRSFMDEVKHNAVGNEITMVKRCSTNSVK